VGAQGGQTGRTYDTDAHTTPSRVGVFLLAGHFLCSARLVRMFPRNVAPAGAAFRLSYTRSTFAACNPLGPVFTSKLTLAPSSNVRYPLPTIDEKCTNTSSPLSRWMNP